MPYTIIGDPLWTDYEISADLFLDDGGWAGVMGRITRTGNGWDNDPNGYYARLYPDGGCALYLASEHFKGSRERQLAVGEARRWRWNQWHNLKLRFADHAITVLVDGVEVITTEDKECSHGMAGLITGGEGNARNTACFDNLLINQVNGPAVSPTVFVQDGSPIYRQ
jgi:galactosylceramidase